MGDVVSSHLDESRREMITGRTRDVMSEFGATYEQQYAVALFNSVRYEIEGGGGAQSQLLHRKDPLAGRSIFSGSLYQHLEENRKFRNRFVSVPNTYNISLYEGKAAHDRGLHPKTTINCAGYKALASMDEYMELMNNSLPVVILDTRFWPDASNMPEWHLTTSTLVLYCFIFCHQGLHQGHAPSLQVSLQLSPPMMQVTAPEVWSNPQGPRHGIKAKVSNHPFIKCATQYPLILWHPYARHYYFCVMTEKEQKKWHAVLQDCVRHSNNGLPEEQTVQTPAFTDAVRLYRQSKGHYGTWDMMCGEPPQILANLVMETLHPELRNIIGPRLKGKMQQRQRNWMLISDAVYKQVLTQTTGQFEALVDTCEAQRSQLDARLRTDMDQLITTKEHVSNKIRALVLPKAEQTLRSNVQPYISSILEALMDPTSRGFSEVRDIFFKELVEISKNSLNEGGKEKLGEHMDRLSMLAFHPVKMQSCYEKVEELNLEGLQQRFDVSSPSVFVSRAQILMREKYDYDSSTVRKKFFREALLQIIIPYMLKQLSPSFSTELPRFKELIFEDFSRFLLVENMFEEVVLQSVSKDIMMAVKEAAVQRRHNLYRDSIILTNSDPNLHLLEENSQVDWATKFGGDETEGPLGGGAVGSGSRRRQVVSMIQLDGVPLPYESCLEVPGVDLIPEEGAEVSETKKNDKKEEEKEDEEEEEEKEDEEEKEKEEEMEEKEEGEEEEKEEEVFGPLDDPKSPDSVNEIRGLINPVVEMVLPASEENLSEDSDETEPPISTITLEDGVQEDVTHITTVVEDVPRKSLQDKSSPQSLLQQLKGSRKKKVDPDHQEETAIKNVIDKIETAVQEDDSERIAEVSAVESDCESSPKPLLATDTSSHGDSGFQSPTNEGLDEGEPQPITNGFNGEDKIIDPIDVEVTLA
ncbi:protein Niban 2a isoform X2 [Cheilinus undulatus]|uniref:protein Niban 2a isoform X2 n=1 Tax=Cheilinus undulatus TaxID=241271 RepID=UPI001BD2E4AD|nr:protein Niban 2a isoform X2 [Cheilinus undulatus]